MASKQAQIYFCLDQVYRILIDHSHCIQDQRLLCLMQLYIDLLAKCIDLMLNSKVQANLQNSKFLSLFKCQKLHYHQSTQ